VNVGNVTDVSQVSTLNTEVTCTSETSATLLTSTQCNHPRIELKLTVNGFSESFQSSAK
jgi:hypothetical protein